MTYSIKLTPFTAALMDGAARAAGCSVEALLAGTISAWQNPARTKSERRAAAAAAAAPTAEQAAELARQLAEHGGTAAVAADPLAVRTPGYDPEFTPDPENFGKLN